MAECRFISAELRAAAVGAFDEAAIDVITRSVVMLLVFHDGHSGQALWTNQWTKRGPSESCRVGAPAVLATLDALGDLLRTYGIDKHLTGHCRRHSYNSELAAAGINSEVIRM